MKFEEILQLQFHEKFSKWDKNLRNSTLCAASCDASIVLQCGNFVILLPLPLSQKSREINVFTKNIKNLTLNWFDGRNFALQRIFRFSTLFAFQDTFEEISWN